MENLFEDSIFSLKFMVILKFVSIWKKIPRLLLMLPIKCFPVTCLKGLTILLICSLAILCWHYFRLPNHMKLLNVRSVCFLIQDSIYVLAVPSLHSCTPARMFFLSYISTFNLFSCKNMCRFLHHNLDCCSDVQVKWYCEKTNCFEGLYF